MNDRIRELAEQCESFGSWENKTYSFDKEKFAELIIRECIEWCDAHATIDGSAQQIRNSIKNYFGVE